MTISRIFISLPIFLFALSCETKTCVLNQNLLNPKVELEIIRAEDVFFEAKTTKEIEKWIQAHPEFTEIYLQKELYLSPSALVDELFSVHQDSTLIVLYDSVKLEYPEVVDLQKELKIAFQHIQYYFPDFKIPKVYTFVSGFTSDLVVTEDVIIIGLDYFLPSTHTFQPDLPRYMADRYEQNYLVPMIVTAISARFDQSSAKDNTMLAEMIFYGKAYHFTKAILPCTSDQFIIGYTPNEISDSFANEEMIWSHFIENELLYETNPFEIRKYMGEAPFTDAISTNAPGRLGRWLGWNIVDDYRENTQVDLATLMATQDPETIFRGSGYRPR